MTTTDEKRPVKAKKQSRELQDCCQNVAIGWQQSRHGKMLHWIASGGRAPLGNGGLFNPEMMDHERVRDLLMECRSLIEA